MGLRDKVRQHQEERCSNCGHSRGSHTERKWGALTPGKGCVHSCPCQMFRAR